jgi:hypothetical protein
MCPSSPHPHVMPRKADRRECSLLSRMRRNSVPAWLGWRCAQHPIGDHRFASRKVTVIVPLPRLPFPLPDVAHRTPPAFCSSWLRARFCCGHPRRARPGAYFLRHAMGIPIAREGPHCRMRRGQFGSREHATMPSATKGIPLPRRLALVSSSKANKPRKMIENSPIRARNWADHETRPATKRQSAPTDRSSDPIHAYLAARAPGR